MICILHPDFIFFVLFENKIYSFFCDCYVLACSNKPYRRNMQQGSIQMD